MPSYYNPYSFYPATYANQMGYNMMPMQPMNTQQSFTQPPIQRKYLEWVEGEVGAKAFQMPPDLPPNQPIPLWDSTDTVIYLKSWGPMGIPNPLQKITYTMPEQLGQQFISGNSEPQPAADMSQYVTKDELNQMRNEMQSMFNSANGNQRNRNSGNNQNGSNNSGNNWNNGNRGGT